MTFPDAFFCNPVVLGLVPLRRTRGLRSVAKKGKAPRQGSHIPKAQSHRFLPSGFLPSDLREDSVGWRITKAVTFVFPERMHAEPAFRGGGA